MKPPAAKHTFWPLTGPFQVPKRAAVTVPKANSALLCTMSIQLADGDIPPSTTTTWECVTCGAHITDEAEANAHGCPPVQWRGSMELP